MNKLLMLGASILCIQGMIAAPLTPEEALARLASESPSDSPYRAPASRLMELKQTIATPENEPAVYVFTAADRSLVFVGADDNAQALLGYTDEPCSGEMPPQLKWWLSEYASVVGQASARSRRAGASSAAADPAMAPVQSARTIYKYIAPMVKTAWNQSEPYNNLCPLVGGKRCYTGCTATAAAQVMKYFNYPATGTGTKTYTPNTNASNTSGLCTSQLSMDMSTVNFDWTNMLNRYESGSYTTAQANAVALLMQAVGYISEMNYGTASSGASTATTIQGLKQYFEYNEPPYSWNAHPSDAMPGRKWFTTISIM